MHEAILWRRHRLQCDVVVLDFGECKLDGFERLCETENMRMCKIVQTQLLQEWLAMVHITT